MQSETDNFFACEISRKSMKQQLKQTVQFRMQFPLATIHLPPFGSNYRYLALNNQWQWMEPCQCLAKNVST